MRPIHLLSSLKRALCKPSKALSRSSPSSQRRATLNLSFCSLTDDNSLHSPIFALHEHELHGLLLFGRRSLPFGCRRACPLAILTRESKLLFAASPCRFFYSNRAESSAIDRPAHSDLPLTDIAPVMMRWLTTPSPDERINLLMTLFPLISPKSELSP
jgi:hypothetical protein